MRSVLLAVFLLALLGVRGASASGPEVVVLRVKGTVNPALAGYVERGLSVAEERGAQAAVIMLDTPGGLDQAMRDIIQHILSARVPVVVYVAPKGARAASAGAFITLSAHIAAMAPGTGIGAAHPVLVGQRGGPQDAPTAVEEKILNDALAYIRSLAELRGRSVEWAEKMVRESASLNAREAQEKGVIDLVAEDLPALLEALHGRTVSLPSGQVTLSTRGAQVSYVNMSPMESFLFAISNPNVAFILLSLAMLALFFELSNPGAIVPGVVGGILLLLSLYSLGNLPVNWAAFLLLLMGFGLVVAEIFVASHGALIVGGLAALAIGGLMLMSGSAPPGLRLDPRVLAGVLVAMAGYFTFVTYAVVKARRRRPTLGYGDLVGQVAVARTPLEPEGMVFLNGEYWQAVCPERKVEPGEEVVVTKVEGMKVWVESRKERGE